MVRAYGQMAYGNVKRDRNQEKYGTSMWKNHGQLDHNLNIVNAPIFLKWDQASKASWQILLYTLPILKQVDR